MAQLLSGTRIYGTATVDTQLFVNGTTQSVSTNTGALQVVGGVGVGGSLFVGAASTLSGVTKVTDTTEAANTTTGALVVSGGVSVAKDLRVFGTIYGLVNGTVIGVITTATNLAAGTTGQIPFQVNPGITNFFGPGTAGQLLVSAGASASGPVFTNTASIYVGRSSLTDDLVGGAAGSLPYQTGVNDTTFLGIGGADTILTSSGTAPQWSSTGSLVVGKAAQSDTAAITNDLSSNNTHYLTFVSTTTGYTPLKGAALSGLTYKPNGGYLGLGTSSPSYKLHIVETADQLPAYIERPANGDILQLYNSTGLTTAETELAFAHKDSANAAIAAARISGYATSLGAGAVSGGLIFYVRNAGVETSATTITPAGNLGVGVNPIYRLDVGGGARITGITTITNATASSSPTTGALQVTGGAGISGNINTAGQISSTRANNTATGSGQIYLNGATGNRIDFGTAGLSAPTLSTRSVGTKVVLYPNLSVSTTDFALGVDTGAFWSSVASGSDSFQWYAANTNIASLSGGGNLTLSGDLAVNGGDITSSQSSFNLLASGVTTLALGTAGTAITIGSNSGGTTTVRNILAVSTNTNSSAVGNGALVVSGGASIASDLRVGGTIFGTVSVSGIISTATNISGGTAGQVPYQTGPGATSFFGPGTAGNVLVSNGTSAPTYNNTLTLAGTTAATNATSGALTVAGGAGIAGDLYVGNALTVGTSGSWIGGATIYRNSSGIGLNSNGRIILDYGTLLGESVAGLTINGNATYSTNLSIGVAQNITRNGRPGGLSGAFIDAEGARAISFGTNSNERMAIEGNGDVIIRNDLQIQGGDLTTNQTTFNLVDTTATTVNFARAATAITIGAASGSTTVRNNLTVAGNLTVQGTTTVVDSTVTNVSDPIFTIGTGPNGGAPSADDNKDRGIAFHWHNGATPRIGFFGYDDSTGYFTFLTSATFVNEVATPAGGTSRGAVDVNLAGGATGSIPYQSGANVSTFLPIGSANQVLTVQGGLPVWTAASGITAGNATTVEMTNDVASATPQFIAFVGTATGPAAVKASAMSGLTFIPSTARLGIGINTPTYPLHINVPSGLGSIGLSGTAANAQTMQLMQGVTGVTNSGFSIYDASNSTTRLMIGSTGNVGIGTGTQDPSDRLHISNSGGTAQLRVGDTASTQAGILLVRRNSGIDTQTHWFNASANSPWYLFGQNLTWTGERTGTVTATHAHRPYYEAYAPVVGYKEFGFANVTTGAIATGNLIPSLVLKNDGFVGINTTNPTDYLTIDAKGSSASNYGLTIRDSTVNAVNETTGIKFAWNTANAADIRAIITNITTGASALAFGTSNDGATISERMRIAQGGNVGIGELDPGAYGKLTVRISSNTGVGAGGSAAIWLQNANGAANNAATIFFGDDAAAAMGAVNFVHADYANNYGDISFDTRGAGGYAERLRITRDGRVGIGIATPNATLDVVGSVFISGITTVTNTAVSTSSITGALQVSGGVGVGGNLNVGGSINIPISSANLVLGSSFVNAGSPQIVLGRGTTGDTNLISGNAGVLYGGVSTGIRILANGSGAIDLATYNGNWGVTGYGIALRVTSDRTVQTFGTNQATSTTTGALQVIGGVGIGGNLHVGGTINGTIVGTISGIATTATTVTITNDNATTTDQYVTFVGASSGNAGIRVSATTGLVWKPNTGSLGIGVSPSIGKLHVSGKGYFSTEVQANAAIMNSATVNAANSAVFGSNSAAVPILITRNSDPAGTDLYINSTGDVSIGSYSLSSKFGVSGPATATAVNSQSMVARLASNTGNADFLEFSNVRGTAGADWTTAGFRIQQKVDSTWMGYMQFNGTASGVNSGGISFGSGTTTVNANTVAERMRITPAGNVGVGTTAPSTRLSVQASGANGIALLQDTGTTTNSGRLFFQASGGTFAETNVGNVLQWSSGATIGSDTGTARMVLNSSGFLGLGTTLSPLTYLDIRHNNSGSQSSQVSGFTLRTNENNGMEWHLQHTNGYQGWVAAARVNNNGASWGQAYLEFITAGSSGGNQTSVMALHGNGNVSIGSTAAPAYKLFVNGSFAATTKSFVIDHPIKSGWKLRYASLEGPENGVYVRGRLKDNNVIVLPDYWRELVDVDTITVEITPVGKYQKLYVDSINPQYVVIATESDMPVNCFYTVYGERKDVGKLIVEYEE